MGRYYYSCYGPVKNYYENSFRRTLSSIDNPHATLIVLLKNSPFIKEQKLEKTLENLRRNRNPADIILEISTNRLK